MKKIKRPYKTTIIFNKIKYLIFIKINPNIENDEEYHYDIELQTTEKISGNEFQNLKKYLEDEGYIDAAIDYYGY